MSEAPPVQMRTIHFSRVVKREIGGQGYTVRLMLEARVSASYPAHEAVLDLLEVKGRPKLDLRPLPEPVVVLDSATDIIEMAMAETLTEWFDPQEAVIAEHAKAEERAIELLTPTLVKPAPKSLILGGSSMARRVGLPVLDDPAK